MNYYTIEKNFIVQYDVQLDTEILERLKWEIIEKCSYITHVQEKVFDCPFDPEHIRNYHKKQLGYVDENDFFNTSRMLYQVEYDYYEHPTLVQWINEVQGGKTSSIRLIQDFQEGKVNDYWDSFNELEDMIKRVQENNLPVLSAISTKCNEIIDTYTKNQELNKNQVSAYQYKQKVLDCIHLNKINQICIDTVLAVEDFFKGSSSNTLDSNLGKILCLNNDCIGLKIKK